MKGRKINYWDCKYNINDMSKFDKKMSYIGTIIGLTGFALAWIFFGWKLVLILFLAYWGNNICVKHQAKL